MLAEVKLLVDWTKGKNLIISSAAHTATQIRGPYDVINLSACLLGLPMNRAKAALSSNCRSLVLKALRKKYFYKETIRVDRLLPNEQFGSAKFKLVDWIGWNSVASEGGANQLEPSSNFDELPGPPICSLMEDSCEKPHNSDVSVFAKLSEQSSDQEQTPPQTKDDTLQVDRTEGLIDCGQSILPTSFHYQKAVLEESGNSEVVLDPFVQAAADCSADPESIVKHVDFVQDAMEVDTIESCKPNLVAGDNIPSTSGTSMEITCSALPHGIELSGTSLDDQGPSQSSEILNNPQFYLKKHSDCYYGEREKTLLVHKIPSGTDAWQEDKDLNQPNGVQVEAEACRGTSEPVMCPLGVVDNNASVMEGKIEQNMDVNIEQTVENETEPIDTKTRESISVKPTSHGQQISSTSYTRSTDASCESDKLKEQNSEEMNAPSENSIANTHELLLKFPYPSGKVDMSTIRSEKQRHKLRPYHPSYLPFLGFLRSMRFKKKICKSRGRIKHM